MSPKAGFSPLRARQAVMLKDVLSSLVRSHEELKHSEALANRLVDDRKVGNDGDDAPEAATLRMAQSESKHRERLPGPRGSRECK